MRSHYGAVATAGGQKQRLPPCPTPRQLCRYIANNGAAFSESILRVLFGYEPAWLAAADPAGPTLQGVDRGLSGTLSCIRGPSGAYMTATLQPGTGVVYAWGAPECTGA